MAAATPSELIYMLKQYMHGQRIENLIYRKNPTMALLPTDTNFQGADDPFPVYVSPGAGVSGDFSIAQSTAANGTGYQFRLTNGKLYGVVPLDDESLMRTRSRIGSYADLKKQELEGKVEYMGEILSGQLFSDGGGGIGVLTSNPANTSSQTFTVSSASAINQIENGMQLVASADSGASTSHALRNNYVTVTAVDRNALTFTATQSDDVSTWAVGDTIFLRGLFGGASAANNAIPMKGLPAWFPLTVTSTAFFNVDRTVDDRLTGTRYTSVTEATGTGLIRLQGAATKCWELFRGRPDLGVVTPSNFLDMSIELQNAGPNRTFDKKVQTGYAGIAGLEVTTPAGVITVISDTACKAGDGWLLNTEYMVLKSMGELVHVMDADGKDIMRAASTPTYEMRLVSYPQLGIQRPTEFARIGMPT